MISAHTILCQPYARKNSLYHLPTNLALTCMLCSQQRLQLQRRQREACMLQMGASKAVASNSRLQEHCYVAGSAAPSAAAANGLVTIARQSQRQNPNNATPPQMWCAPNTGLSVTWVGSRHGHDIARLQLQAHPLRPFAQRAKCCMCIKSWGASAGSKGAHTIVV